jgi:hypothetical protein
MPTMRAKWQFLRRNLATASVVLITLAGGCRRLPETIVSPAFYRHEACNTADSPAICAQVQKCFPSHVSTVVCRELEDDAIKLWQSKPGTDNNGLPDALKY